MINMIQEDHIDHNVFFLSIKYIGILWSIILPLFSATFTVFPM